MKEKVRNTHLLRPSEPFGSCRGSWLPPLSARSFFSMFDEPIRSERQPPVASLGSGAKHFYARSIWAAAKDFENIKCVMNSPVREFLEANTPGAGRRVNLERRGQQ